MELVPRQRQLMLQRGARIDDPEEDALSLAHANGLAAAQHLPVDGAVLELDVARAAGGEVRLPFVEQQRHFLVVCAGFIRPFHDQHAELARVGALLQVVPCVVVAVIPAGARGIGHERIAATPPARRHARRAFLVGAIDLGRDVKPVPVHDVFIRGVVPHFHVEGPALPRAKQGARRLAVVADGLDHASGRDLEIHGTDTKRGIRRPREGLGGRRRRRVGRTLMLAAGHCGRRGPRRCGGQEFTPGHLRNLAHQTRSDSTRGVSGPAATPRASTHTPDTAT